MTSPERPRALLSPLVLGAHVGAPVVIGALIYVLWRSPHLLVFSWASALGADGIVQVARDAVRGVTLPGVALFNAPDALWTYALTFAVGAVWSIERSLGRRTWLGACALVALGPEVGQGFGVVPGTFDLLDVVFCGAAFALACRLTRPVINVGFQGGRP